MAKDKRVEWFRVFTSEEEAVQRVEERKPQLLIIDGKRLCMVRQGHVFRVVQDRCPHQGESLSKGTLNYLGELICPLHHYCFELTTGRELQARSGDLRTFPVRMDETGLYVGVY